MGATKTSSFTSEQNVLANFFKVLGHPARVAIIEELLSKDTCICKELVEEIGLAQSTISQHLKELKGLGIITGKVSGAKVCYCLNHSKWLEIQELMNLFFRGELHPNITQSSIQKCC